MLNVFGVDFVVFDQVAQNARQERNVRTGTNRRVYPPQKRTRKRGSTTIKVARVVFASIAQRKPTGCASAALPPITITTLAFLISTQWLVIAPRPNVEQDLLPLVRVRHAPGCRPRAYPARGRIFALNSRFRYSTRKHTASRWRASG